MKIKILLFGIIFLGLTSFSASDSDAPYVNIGKKSNIKYQSSEGEKLIAKSDCIGCHKIDKKLIGPSYLDIAKKYPLNEKSINYLASKIIKGGSGVWGAIPMAAHSTLKKEDAKLMAKYILSVK
ncbi:Cytochrome c551/c552 [Flavobacterium micromati]|uniref:Cytochrome c551/c552 n=1 Tax=Flavobacterium micromati TaxID=229205 RepID=A0A1M5J7E4_9FLAO|nr:c-type cytochrome [Flavobacterium micromati]SHG36219.1 Cytochrome c551/c552 [Flavobacterium micromati]